MGYHGQNRGRFAIDWPMGMAKLNSQEQEDPDDHDTEEKDDHNATGSEGGTSSAFDISGRNAMRFSFSVYFIAAMLMQ